MKKILAVIFAAIFIAVLFPFSASAEDLKAPTVQYKILNHDKVSLKWSKVEGAESYYIYKRDDKTGEYIKKFEVKSNKVTLKNLSPDTEYSYSVVAVKGGEESKSSNKVTFTTPSEWYYSFESNESNPWGTYYFCDWKDSGQCYRQHYDGTGKEIFKIDFIYKALVEYYDENYSPPGYELRVQCQNKGYVYFNVLIYDDGDYYNPDFGLRDT